MCEGAVTTLVGGAQSYVDGPITNARVFAPYGICVDSKGNVFFSEELSNTIRMITTSGD